MDWKIEDPDQIREIMPLPPGFPILRLDDNICLMQESGRTYARITKAEPMLPFSIRTISLSSTTTLASNLAGSTATDVEYNASDFDKLFDIPDKHLEAYVVALESDIAPIECVLYLPGATRRFGTHKRPEVRWNSDISHKRRPTIMMNIVRDITPEFHLINPKRATTALNPSLVRMWFAGKRYKFEVLPAEPKIYTRISLDYMPTGSSGPGVSS